MLEEDSLDLRKRVASLLEERALLLDPERVVVRAYALLVRGTPAAALHGSWSPNEATRAVREAVNQLLEEEACDLWSSPERATGDSFSRFAVSLGLDVDSLMAARARFHALELATRRAFLHLVLQGRPLETLSRLEDRHGTLRRAREALDVFRQGLPSPSEPSPPPTHPAP